MSSRNLCATLWALLVFCGCGGDDPSGPDADPGPLPTTESFQFERNRSAQTGNIHPVLTESGSGFDAREVDSPSVVMDTSRAGGDAYLLFYEATDGGGASSIGVVSSANANFVTLSIGRTQLFSAGPAGSGYENGATDPTVLIDDGPASSARYRMWFEGRSGGGSVSAIFTSSSDDGLNWTLPQRCGGLNPSFGTARVADPSVLVDAGGYRMWFEALDISGIGRIGHAVSTDGVNWEIRDAVGNSGNTAAAVFEPRSEAAFDGHSVNAPSVTIDVSEPVGSPYRYQLWYEAGDVPGATESTIGLANSNDGLSWVRLDLPVLAPSSDSLIPLPFDSGDLEHPSVWIDLARDRDESGHFMLWYTGDGEGNSSPNRIGFARGAAVTLTSQKSSRNSSF
jgi:hypothetical protein